MEQVMLGRPARLERRYAGGSVDGRWTLLALGKPVFQDDRIGYRAMGNTDRW